MTHYYAELALLAAAMYLVGCPIGAAARRLWHGRRRGPSGES